MCQYHMSVCAWIKTVTLNGQLWVICFFYNAFLLQWL